MRFLRAMSVADRRVIAESPNEDDKRSRFSEWHCVSSTEYYTREIRDQLVVSN